MSTRIHRGTTNAEAPPIVWQRAGGNGPATARREGAENAGAPAGEAAALALAQQMEARLASARQQAKAEGETAARLAANRQLEPVLSSLQAMVKELSTQRERVRSSAEEDVVKLAIAIARRVLNRELATDPGAILGLVKAAFGKVNAREVHRLRVAPADAVVLDQHRAQLALPEAVEMIRDASLPTGSAIFETARGQMDASADSQLGEIERGLTDVLRRRTSS